MTEKPPLEQGSGEHGSDTRSDKRRGEKGIGPTVTVEVRGEEAAWVVAGRPLLSRLCRQLEARGVSALRIVSTGEGSRWRALLDKGGCGLAVSLHHPGSEEHKSLASEKSLGPAAPAGAAPAGADPASAAPEGPHLDGAALYDGDALAGWLVRGAGAPAPVPLVCVRGPADRAAAERAVWRSIRKSLQHDGLVAYYLARPLSMPLTRLAARLGLSPNQVSGFGLVVGLGAGVVAALGGYLATLGAALLFFVGLILDCVDGDLARGTMTTSRLGQWLDTITDDLSYVALALGIGVGIARQGGHPLWLWLGLATLGLVALGQAVIYRWLVRSGGPVDAARYPWFFMGREGLAHEGKRGLVGWLSFAVRRDSLTLVFLGLALAGLPWGILALLFGGSVVYAVLLVIDRVLARRRMEESA